MGTSTTSAQQPNNSDFKNSSHNSISFIFSRQPNRGTSTKMGQNKQFSISKILFKDKI